MTNKRGSCFPRKLICIIFSFFFFVNMSGTSTPAETLPDLIIYSVDAPTTVIEGNLVSITVRIKNIGTKNITTGTIITNALLVDGTTVATSSYSQELPLDGIRYLNLSWTATLGATTQRNIRIVIDPQNTLQELDENNNIYEQIMDVRERDTDLTFSSDIFLSGKPRVGEQLSLFIQVTNLGKNTTKQINVSFYVNNTIKQHQIIEGLARGTHINLSFAWIPHRFGPYELKIRVDPNNIIEEYDENNNQKIRSVSVDASRLTWWNTSWHYRQFYNIAGTGNLSVAVNFTQLLKNLGVVNKTFDNTSIRIIRYNENGSMHSLITNVSFNKTNSYHNVTNAQGTLIWQITAPAYYYLYFDVKENPGVRSVLPELPFMQPSGNPSVQFKGSAEGWWFEQLQTINTFYIPNQKLYINMSSTAYANNATARFSKEGNFDHSKPLTTTNSLTWKTIETFSPAQKGNWTLELLGFDHAGYQTEILRIRFYVGYPDLILENIRFSSEFPQDSPIYEGNTILITIQITARNASVNNVNISVYINGVYNKVSSKPKVNLSKGSNTVSFTWYAATKGTYTVSVYVDPLNKIPESNNNNNNKSASLSIEGTPDLGIVSIYVPPTIFQEETPVPLSANIKNSGRGKAVNYTVNLYLEQNTQNIMYYSSVKNSTLITLAINETKNITLNWPSAHYGQTGEWIVGFKVLATSLKPDYYLENNSKAFFSYRLKVNKTENLAPVILLTPLGTYERGQKVTITAQITDASGIRNVTIRIKNPENTRYTKILNASSNNQYTYIFTHTKILGIYNISILATDASAAVKKSWKNSSFEIVEDTTPPVFVYYGVHPSVQLVGKPLTMSCIVTDINNISSVWIHLQFPDSTYENHTLDQQKDSHTYSISLNFTKQGRYRYRITAEDTIGNRRQTPDQEFWITQDLNDTDSDGMSDTWEMLYGLNPRDPTDASGDLDNDGYTNLEEYQQGTNPQEKNTLFGTINERILEHINYLIASVILFGFLMILVWFGLRRMKQ